MQSALFHLNREVNGLTYIKVNIASNVGVDTSKREMGL